MNEIPPYLEPSFTDLAGLSKVPQAIENQGGDDTVVLIRINRVWEDKNIRNRRGKQAIDVGKQGSLGKRVRTATTSSPFGNAVSLSQCRTAEERTRAG